MENLSANCMTLFLNLNQRQISDATTISSTNISQVMKLKQSGLHKNKFQNILQKRIPHFLNTFD